MTMLFRLETDRVLITWSRRGPAPAILSIADPPPGRLAIHPRRREMRLGPETRRAGVPSSTSGLLDELAGPHLFEQTDYTVLIQGKGPDRVSLENRDLGLLRDLQELDDGRTVHGVLNFGSHVGYSEFTVRVGGQPELDFEVEVFPTKLDYAHDYERIVAEIQEILAGLVLDYLRSTYRLSLPGKSRHPTHIEWLMLLQRVVADLEQAVAQIARRPQWGLSRDPQVVRLERVKRVDAALRRRLMRQGRTAQRVQERAPRPTLDTPEHRWVASQLAQIRRRLAWLRSDEGKLASSPRRTRVLLDLRLLDERIARLEQAAPVAEAKGQAPAGFASLQLLYSPGYREAYRACLLLTLGLHLVGGPVGLSLKSLSVLYEYWCFLTVVRLVGRELGQAVPAEQLLRPEQRGLRVQLEKGRESTVAFAPVGDRRITVTYNPRFQGEALLIAQQPDLVLTLYDRSWPMTRLVIDAKYRVDATPEYVDRYRSPGPPEDALNVLHRYRDAILESDSQDPRPKHTVIQGTALFPYREREPGMYRFGRLWRALGSVGVGAIPLLPEDTGYLAEWLRGVLRRGGWALADRAIPYRVAERSADWRLAAAESVLVGTLRGGQAAEHLAWITRERTYYTPRTGQPRLYAARAVALYLPSEIRAPGAVSYLAEVVGIDVVPRGSIATPWMPRGDGAALHVVYRLGELRPLTSRIENRRRNGGGSRFATPRWTSSLAMGRARLLEELFLETEPEWRLYEDLSVSGAAFELLPGPPKLVDPESPGGRAWFMTEAGRARYTGLAGYLFRPSNGGQDRYYPRSDEVATALS